MKIIFLNIWEGKLEEAVKKFIEEQVRDTDIFCFQEFYGGITGTAQGTLSNYNKISAYKFLNKEEYFSQATFVRKNLPILSSQVLLEKDMTCGLAISVEVELGDKRLYVCNAHGISRPGEKMDTAGRLKQSQVLIKSFEPKKESAQVIGGDFNLFPNTESVRMFEKNGYKNVIKDFKIQTTRNHYVWDKWPENPYYYSDYVFVDPRFLEVKKFTVPENEVSDHLPLILHIEPKT